MRVINRGGKDGWANVEVCLDPEEASEGVDMIYMMLAMDCRATPKPGKRTAEIVADIMGKETVEKIVCGEIMQRNAPKALDDAGIDLLGEPQFFYSKAYEEGEPFVFQVATVIKPKLTLSSYDPVVITDEAGVVPESEVDYQIDKFLERALDGEPDPTQTTVARGAFLSMGLETRFPDGSIDKEHTFDAKDYMMGRGSMPEEFDDGILGMKVGETRTVTFTAPNQKTGDKQLFTSKVTLNALLKRVKPELTDEWVKRNFTAFSTVEDLRKNVRRELEKHMGEKFAEYQNFLAAAQLADRIEGEIPDIVFQSQMNQTMKDLQQALAQQGKTLEEYCTENDTTEKELRQEMLLRTREELRQVFALDALARHENITLTEQDMQDFYHEIAPGSEVQFATSIAQRGGVRRAREQALRMKANKWAVDHAVIGELAPAVDPESYEGVEGVILPEDPGDGAPDAE